MMLMMMMKLMMMMMTMMMIQAWLVFSYDDLHLLDP
jgi:hypothetical protein